MAPHTCRSITDPWRWSGRRELPFGALELLYLTHALWNCLTWKTRAEYQAVDHSSWDHSRAHAPPTQQSVGPRRTIMLVHMFVQVTATYNIQNNESLKGNSLPASSIIVLCNCRCKRHSGRVWWLYSVMKQQRQSSLLLFHCWVMSLNGGAPAISLLSSFTFGQLSGGASGGGSKDRLSSILCVFLCSNGCFVFYAAMIGAVLEVSVWINPNSNDTKKMWFFFTKLNISLTADWFAVAALFQSDKVVDSNTQQKSVSFSVICSSSWPFPSAPECETPKCVPFTRLLLSMSWTCCTCYSWVPLNQRWDPINHTQQSQGQDFSWDLTTEQKLMLGCSAVKGFSHQDVSTEQLAKLHH